MTIDDIYDGMHVLVRVTLDHALPPEVLNGDDNHGSVSAPVKSILVEGRVDEVDTGRDPDTPCVSVVLKDRKDDGVEHYVWVCPCDIVPAPEALHYDIPGDMMVRRLMNGLVLEREDKTVAFRMKDNTLWAKRPGICNWTVGDICPYDIWYNYRALDREEVAEVK